VAAFSDPVEQSAGAPVSHGIGSSSLSSAGGGAAWRLQPAVRFLSSPGIFLLLLCVIKIE
jgi:hypothetical protein